MDVSSLVSTWMNSPNLKRSAKLLPHHRPISPRPERLGLGADPDGNTLSGLGHVGRTKLTLNGTRKLPLRERGGVASVSPPSNERDSSEDDVCSRSAAVAKRATAFSTELARSRKRKKSRKHNCSDTGSSGKTALTKCENGELDTSCVIAERPSVMSATSNVEKNCNCADVRVATSCDYLCELTVAREGHQQSTEDSDGGVRSSVNDGQPLREGHPEGVKLRQPKKRHILRGGSSLCCVKRTRKRFPNTNGPCESNVHPNSMFSNLDLTSSSRTKTVSIDVVKQRTHSKRLRDQSRIESPPTRFVDLNDSQMSSDVGPVGSSCHKATATMETRQARKWSRRQRRRLAIKVSSSSQLTRRLYLRKV